MNTKACNLTEDEIIILIKRHGFDMTSSNNQDEHIDRINYLNKRLKSFKEVEYSTAKPLTAEQAKDYENQFNNAKQETKSW